MQRAIDGLRGSFHCGPDGAIIGRGVGSARSWCTDRWLIILLGFLLVLFDPYWYLDLAGNRLDRISVRAFRKYLGKCDPHLATNRFDCRRNPAISAKNNSKLYARNNNKYKMKPTFS